LKGYFKFCFISLFVFLMGLGAVTYNVQAYSNYWYNKEIGYFKYEGYIQFVPKNLCGTYDDIKVYGMEYGKHVKRAYINYTIDGKSIKDTDNITGRRYARNGNSITALNSKSNQLYKIKRTVYDSLNPVSAKTHFWYGWGYFK